MPIANAEEVEQVFDAISYCKGGSVVRMVHAVVGKEKFVQGLRAYMNEFKYGNATTGDLWKAWELASGKPVTDMMGQWTTQMGFPLLEVRRPATPPQPRRTPRTTGRLHRVAASATHDGCSLCYVWWQPLPRMVAASATYGCRWLRPRPRAAWSR